jgi:hypothetical protein
MELQLSGYQGERRYIALTLDLGTRWGEWSASRPGRLERTTGTHWIGGWVALRAGLDTEATVKVLYFCR